MVYMSSEGPSVQPEKDRFGYKYCYVTDENDHRVQPLRFTGNRRVEFQLQWQAVIREWFLRWGTKVAGWWVDSCYAADVMYRFPDELAVGYTRFVTDHGGAITWDVPKLKSGLIPDEFVHQLMLLKVL